MDEPLKSCLSLLSSVMRVGYPSDFDRLPLERLSAEELDELALVIKARCKDELPSAMTAKMDLQRREKKRLRKEKIQRDDERHKALTQLVRYAGAEMARKAESLEEIEFEIAPEGGQPPKLGILDYVLDLVERAGGPVDPYEIAKKVLTVFPDRYPPETWDDHEDRERLGRTLVKRALEHQEKERSFDEAISKALQEEKTGAHYVKGETRLATQKTKPLHAALKKIGIGSYLERYESRDLRLNSDARL